ncbi:MAG: ATP synthase F1 subunit epsilon [Alphaproteobacteria bacterium]|nr:MAG: ATP synthase F1 subunit epsilon [Alphaproteobacteria bacterium]
MAWQFDLVAPERKLASADAEAVTLPGAEGDMTAMPGHAPFLTTLRPGVVSVTAGGSRSEYFVSGGFAEISPESITLLAEEAVERSDVSREMLDRLIADAETALKEAGEDTRTVAALRVNDLKFVAETLGL